MANIKMELLELYNHQAFQALNSDCTASQKCQVIEQLVEDMKPDRFVQLLPLQGARSTQLFIIYGEADKPALPVKLNLEAFIQQYGRLYVKKSHYYCRGTGGNMLCHTGRTKEGLFIEVVEPPVTYEQYKLTAVRNVKDGTLRPIKSLNICSGRVVKDKQLVAWVDEGGIYNVPN